MRPRRLTLPGAIDVHVHLRSPGQEHKESVASGTAAALAGGVTCVLAMPNTRPPITDRDRLAVARQRYGEQSRCDVGLFVAATSRNPNRVRETAAHAVGLKIYMGHTFGGLQVRSLTNLMAHFRNWPRERPVVVHAEGRALAMAVGLAWAFGQRLHVAHVSRTDEIGLILAAKQRYAALSCEVTPHHLWLTRDDVPRLGGLGIVRPPLAAPRDRDALWRALPAIDCIATDHAPHTRSEKADLRPPPGVPGLETMLPLMLTAVDAGRLDVDRLIEMTHSAPRRLFGLPAQPGTHVEVEVGPAWVLPESGFKTKADWSPFSGMTVTGRVIRTTLRSLPAYAEGEIRVAPGLGRVVL
jgi:carbamoyl-phosphate synthase/aspartate carbamoyltransferase/dihydroorotase